MKCNHPARSLLLAALASCGARDVCPQVPEPALVIAPPPPVVPPDRSAVAAPANLVLEATLVPATGGHALVAKALGLPVLDAATLTRWLLDPAVGPIVDAGQPAFAAVAIAPDFGPSFALSVPLVAFEIAKERLERAYEVVKKADGGYSLQARQLAAPSDPDGDGILPTSPSRPVCELQPAARDSWALVCSSSTANIEALGPYVARTMPIAATSAAARVVFRPDPLRAAGWLARGALEGIADGADFAAYEHFVNDVDYLEATVATWAQPRVVITTHHRGATSTLTQTAIDDTVLAAPPRAFADLPSDTKMAVFTRAKVGAELIALFAAADRKAHFGLAQRDVAAVTHMLGATFGGKSTTAGLLPSGNAVGALAVVVEGDPKTIVTAWKGAVAGLNAMANAKAPGFQSKPDPKPLPLVRLEKPGRGAPQGCAHLVLSEDQSRWTALGPAAEDDVIPGAKATPKATLKDLAHLYVVADVPTRGHVALVINDTDEQALVALERLRAGGATVAGLPAVSSLMADRSGSGGFARLEPGAPPFTFMTTANAAQRLHTLQIDLPPEQMTGSAREIVKLVVRYTMGVFRKVVRW